MKATTLFLNQTHPFASSPVCAELAPERILCNNVIFAGEFNSHNVRLWVIGNEYGAMGAVWADCLGDAIDELIDADLAGGILIDEETQKTMTADEAKECGRGGNAGELYETDHLWAAEVNFDVKKRDGDLTTLLKFAEARGACASNLDF